MQLMLSTNALGNHHCHHLRCHHDAGMAVPHCDWKAGYLRKVVDASDPRSGGAAVVKMVTQERDRHRARLGVKREGVHGEGLQKDMQDDWLQRRSVVLPYPIYCQLLLLFRHRGNIPCKDA